MYLTGERPKNLSTISEVAKKGSENNIIKTRRVIYLVLPLKSKSNKASNDFRLCFSINLLAIKPPHKKSPLSNYKPIK
jgi:hypothetical protein